MAKEGNNVMVLNKQFNNVFIRWDSNQLACRTLATYKTDMQLLDVDTDLKRNVTSELIVYLGGEDFFRVELPYQFVRDEL